MSKPKILIVEDEILTAKGLYLALKEFGYEIAGVASSAEQALVIAERERPDLVLMDIVLEGDKDGIQAADAIRSRIDTAIVYITSHPETSLFERAMTTEPWGYLSKPLSVKDVHNAVEMALYKREMERELKRANDELERRVQERTAQLLRLTEDLKKEVAARSDTQAALRESEARFRAIFETARDCIYVKDASLRYAFVNPRMVEVLGRPSSAIIGQTDEGLYGIEMGNGMRSVDLRVLEGESVEAEVARQMEETHLTFLEIKTPLRDSNGNVVGICGISRNITGRKTLDSVTMAMPGDYPSPAMRSTLEEARRAARSNTTVLLTGESGSGKDYVARYIHEHSPRSRGAFYVLNCAAVPADLAESELFGHAKGAFTGAQNNKRGLLELAEGGTLLLNEVGDLSLPLQAKLLTFLDTKSFVRVGGRNLITVNARLIAATNSDLATKALAGEFRADLFFRLNVFSLAIPPLRDRPEDLPVLAEEIIRSVAKELQTANVPRLSQAQSARLACYYWPGNVRELRNVLERALILSTGDELELGHLGPNEEDCNQWLLRIPFPTDRSLDDVVRDVKSSLLQEALFRTRGNKKEAAGLLGISRFTFSRQFGKLGRESEDH